MNITQEAIKSRSQLTVKVMYISQKFKIVGWRAIWQKNDHFPLWLSTKFLVLFSLLPLDIPLVREEENGCLEILHVEFFLSCVWCSSSSKMLLSFPFPFSPTRISSLCFYLCFAVIFFIVFPASCIVFQSLPDFPMLPFLCYSSVF